MYDYGIDIVTCPLAQSILPAAPAPAETEVVLADAIRFPTAGADDTAVPVRPVPLRPALSAATSIRSAAPCPDLSRRSRSDGAEEVEVGAIVVV